MLGQLQAWVGKPMIQCELLQTHRLTPTSHLLSQLPAQPFLSSWTQDQVQLHGPFMRLSAQDR